MGARRAWALQERWLARSSVCLASHLEREGPVHIARREDDVTLLVRVRGRGRGRGRGKGRVRGRVRARARVR